MMQKRLYIVRHGETEYNAKGICQGQKLDVGLTDTGRQQAKIAAAKLENFPVGAIYTSPMRRAFETAQIIGHHLHLKPQILILIRLIWMRIMRAVKANAGSATGQCAHWKIFAELVKLKILLLSHTVRWLVCLIGPPAVRCGG